MIADAGNPIWADQSVLQDATALDEAVTHAMRHMSAFSIRAKC
jgi:hypothetical protein